MSHTCEGNCRCNVIPLSPNHPSVKGKLQRTASAGEEVRDYYRKQGAERAIMRAILLLQTDAVLSTNLPVKTLERIVNVIEHSIHS